MPQTQDGLSRQGAYRDAINKSMKKNWKIFDQLLWLYSLLAVIYYLFIFVTVVVNPFPRTASESDKTLGGIIFIVSLIPVLVFLIREGYFHFKKSS